MKRYIINSLILAFGYLLSDIVDTYDFILFHIDISLSNSLFFALIMMPFLALLKKAIYPIYNSTFAIVLLVLLFGVFRWCRSLFNIWVYMPGWVDLLTTMISFIIALLVLQLLFKIPGKRKEVLRGETK